jgi:hypothetical protein
VWRRSSRRPPRGTPRRLPLAREDRPLPPPTWSNADWSKHRRVAREVMRPRRGGGSGGEWSKRERTGEGVGWRWRQWLWKG